MKQLIASLSSPDKFRPKIDFQKNIALTGIVSVGALFGAAAIPSTPFGRLKEFFSRFNWGRKDEATSVVTPGTVDRIFASASLVNHDVRSTSITELERLRNELNEINRAASFLPSADGRPGMITMPMRGGGAQVFVEGAAGYDDALKAYNDLQNKLNEVNGTLDFYRDARLGGRVADFTDARYSNFTNNPQCVLYNFARTREKLGISSIGPSVNHAKDAPRTFGNWIDGADYRITNDGQYRVRAFENDGGANISANSWVSMTSSSVHGTGTTTSGHVIFVEHVLTAADGVKYIYYSEGGAGFHSRGQTGTLKRVPFDEFMSKGTYTGVVTFERV
jgi:hypothetical protein